MNHEGFDCLAEPPVHIIPEEGRQMSEGGGGQGCQVSGPGLKFIMGGDRQGPPFEIGVPLHHRGPRIHGGVCPYQRVPDPVVGHPGTGGCRKRGEQGKITGGCPGGPFPGSDMPVQVDETIETETSDRSPSLPAAEAEGLELPPADPGAHLVIDLHPAQGRQSIPRSLDPHPGQYCGTGVPDTGTAHLPAPP